MQRIDWSVYQFSVQGLYSPRQVGLFGYVATTFVIEGVSKFLSSSSMSCSDDWVISFLFPYRYDLRRCPFRCAVACPSVNAERAAAWYFSCFIFSFLRS